MIVMYTVSEPKLLIDLAVLILLLCTNTDYASVSPVNKLSLIMPLLCVRSLALKTHLRLCVATVSQIIAFYIFNPGLSSFSGVKLGFTL